MNDYGDIKEIRFRMVDSASYFSITCSQCNTTLLTWNKKIALPGLDVQTIIRQCVTLHKCGQQ